MKKFLLAGLILFMFMMGTTGQNRISTESFTHSSAVMFAKSSKINKLVRSVNYFVENVFSTKQKQDLLQETKEFKDKTNIDILSTKSLTRAGVDINRGITFVYFKKVKNQEKMLIFIPILNEKTFPLKFVEIIKNNNKGKPNMDVYPVITSYKTNKIYQVQKDVFSTAIAGYFVLAPHGEWIKEVINLSTENMNTISSDPQYMDYLKNAKTDFDVNVFAKQEFLTEVFGSTMKKKDNKMKRMDGPHTSNEYRRMEVDYEMIDQRGQRKKVEPSPFSVVDYAALGIGYKSKRIQVNLASSLSMDNPIVTMVLGIVKTGLTGNALFAKDVAGYSYLSVNLKYIENLCKNPAPGCVEFANFKKEMNMELGIDLSKDFIPYFSGVVNAIVGNSMGASGQGAYTFYLPMNNPAKCKALWNKIKVHMKKKFNLANQFGERKIAGVPAFWFIDKKNKKSYFLADKRGIYMGNDVPVIKTTLKSRELKKIKSRSVLKEKMAGDVFFLTFIKKNSFISGLMKMQAPQQKGLNETMSSIGDIYLSGGKSSNLVSIDLDIEIIPKKKRPGGK